MRPDLSCSASSAGRQGHFIWLGALVVATTILSACGGGDGGSSAASSAMHASAGASQLANQAQTANQPYTDPIAYSPHAKDGLDASQVAEKSAVMHYQWTSGGKTLNYTTTTGHLTASDANGKPEATMSYVAYTVPSTNGTPRPVTFFYNGGPGSSSIWLRLGSFAPTRVATPALVPWYGRAPCGTTGSPSVMSVPATVPPILPECSFALSAETIDDQALRENRVANHTRQILLGKYCC